MNIRSINGLFNCGLLAAENFLNLRFLLIFTVFGFAFIFSSCLDVDTEIDEENLTNQQRMQQLNISDPLVWNSIVNQSIELEEEDITALKSTAGIKEYPRGNDYYYALFEDLFPSEGDYDFNDVVIKSKLGLSSSKNEFEGYVNSELYNKGGSLPIEIGLMFYEVSGRRYTRIENENLEINGEEVSGTKPWSVSLSELGTTWKIDFKGKSSSKNIWIGYFINARNEILTGGFAPTEEKSFNLPHLHFLSKRNLPWGLEIETDKFAIPNEKALFLDAYPEFKEWAESGGVKNKKWYDSPNPEFTHY